MDKIIDRIYNLLFSDNQEIKASAIQKKIIVGLFLTFIVAFIIITSQFLGSNIIL